MIFKISSSFLNICVVSALGVTKIGYFIISSDNGMVNSRTAIAGAIIGLLLVFFISSS